jgi:hypothetical protein
MASDLIIGPLDSDFQDHVLRICQRLGLSDEGNPTFVGSCIRLLNELAKIKEMSPLDVSTTPPTYGDMRNDYRGWFSMSDSPSEDDTIRWVWNALRDGAQISIARRSPMILAP